jgi:hypothetical protein
MRSFLCLGAGLVLAGASLAFAYADDSNPHLPLFQRGEAGGMRTLLAWPPGVRRAPAFLSELQGEAASDIAAFGQSGKDKDHPDKAFERYGQERYAGDAYESIVIVTRLYGQPGEKTLTTKTWDIPGGHAVGWSDLLKDTSDNAPGLKAIYAYAARALGANPKAKPPKPSDKEATAEYQRQQDRIGWFAPTLEGMPDFAFVPAKDGQHVGGLALIFGRQTVAGYSGNGPFMDEVVVPTELLKPFLTPGVRELFAGEPTRYGLAQRERDDATISGSTAVVLTDEQKPAKTLTLRAEAPSSFFKDDAINLVVDPEALAEASKHDAKSVTIVGKAEAGATLSGVGYDLRVFSVTFDQKIEPFPAVCRQSALHIRPAPGSPADDAHAPEIDVSYPIKFDCSGDQG